jgi:hypothetical protein
VELAVISIDDSSPDAINAAWIHESDALLQKDVMMVEGVRTLPCLRCHTRGNPCLVQKRGALPAFRASLPSAWRKSPDAKGCLCMVNCGFVSRLLIQALPANISLRTVRGHNAGACHGGLGGGCGIRRPPPRASYPTV